MEYLVTLLADALAQSNHVGHIYPFAAKELLSCLLRLSVNDTNKHILVCSLFVVQIAFLVYTDCEGHSGTHQRNIEETTGQR